MAPQEAAKSCDLRMWRTPNLWQEIAVNPSLCRYSTVNKGDSTINNRGFSAPNIGAVTQVTRTPHAQWLVEASCIGSYWPMKAITNNNFNTHGGSVVNGWCFFGVRVEHNNILLQVGNGKAQIEIEINDLPFVTAWQFNRTSGLPFVGGWIPRISAWKKVPPIQTCGEVVVCPRYNHDKFWHIHF